MKLESKSVAALKLGDKPDVIHFDDALRGFGIRLRRGAGGKVLRSFIAQYRRSGATRRYLIGSAETLTCEQARAAAKKVLARVELGEDPQGDKGIRRSKDKSTFSSVVGEYLIHAETRKKKPLRPRSLAETKRYLTGSYFKPLHTMAVDKISRRDVASRLVTITNHSGSPAASRARAVLSAMFSWAMKSGLVENNPVINTLEPGDNGPRERLLIEDTETKKPDELGPIWRACGDDEYGKIIKLIILLGARRAEIGDMCWSEFNTETGIWTLPKERSKNGKANKLPLPELAWDIVDGVPHMASRDQLFGLRGKGFNGWANGKRALDARSGVTGWTLRDIRRSVDTGMNNIGIQPHIVEQVLNHVKRGMEKVYNKSPYERETRAALAQWADHVIALADGGERKILSVGRRLA
jgi:integrase